MEISIYILLFSIVLFLSIGYLVGRAVMQQEWLNRLPKIREESLDKSRQVLKGKFSEQLAPYLPDFPYSPSECRFLGSPIDLIVFKGLDAKEPSEIVFVEVKSGEARLTKQERLLAQAIKERKVTWQEYRVKT